MLKEESEKYVLYRKEKKDMSKLRALKNSYVKLKENFTHKITEEEALNRYMNLLINEAEEDLRNGGKTITLEQWREHMRRDYNIVL